MRRRAKAVMAVAVGAAALMALALVTRGPADVQLDRAPHVVLPRHLVGCCWTSNGTLASVHVRTDLPAQMNFFADETYRQYDVPASLNSAPVLAAVSHASLTQAVWYSGLCWPPVNLSSPGTGVVVTVPDANGKARKATIRTRSDRGRRTLLAVRLSPTGDRALTLERHQPGSDWMPHWLDRLLAHVRGPRRAAIELWVQRTDGTGARRLGRLEVGIGREIEDVQWSPDGTRVSYVVSCPGDDDYRPVLYVLPAQ